MEGINYINNKLQKHINQSISCIPNPATRQLAIQKLRTDYANITRVLMDYGQKLYYHVQTGERYIYK